MNSPKDADVDATTPKKEQPPIDILRRVFVPREREREDGTYVLHTSDKTRYIRGVDGAIRRAEPKVNGKAARRARQMMRKRGESRA